MIDRCTGKVGATDAAIGRLPRAQDLDTRGLDVGQEALAALLTIDPALWRKEVTEFREYLGKYGSRLPKALLEELQTTEAGLG
jgi:phosphoenolpyruvate carboxykinase (GTP)